MKFVCDAPDRKAWFRIETEGEALLESTAMNHAVEKHFRIEWEKAIQSYQPTSTNYIERDIGLSSHIQREMPWFVTLRSADGTPLATAKLPPGAKEDEKFRFIIVAAGNADPYIDNEAAIAALGVHLGLALDHDRCFPYLRRG